MAKPRAFREIQYPTLPLTTEVDAEHYCQLHRRVRRVRPSHAPLHVDTIALVDVVANDTEKTITWQTPAEIPLGGVR